MSVLVTGGLGFIGSKVALQLVKKGIPTIVTDLDPMTNKKKLEKNLKKIDINADLVRYEKLDITDFNNLEKIFKFNKIDAVINLAYGIGTICENNPLLASKINIVGTTSIFGAILLFGGIQSLILGLLAIYIGLIFKQTRNRPLYIVDNFIGFDDILHATSLIISLHGLLNTCSNLVEPVYRWK